MFKIHDVVTRLRATGSNGNRALRDIAGVVVHHDGVPVPDDGYDPIARYAAQAEYHISKGWRRLAYHLRISAKGDVFLTNRFEEITWHAGNFPVNLSHIGICLDGDLVKQVMPRAQRDALIALLEYLCTERPDMPKLVRSTVKFHREVRIGYTSCPSDQVVELVEAYRSPVCRPLI